MTELRPTTTIVFANDHRIRVWGTAHDLTNVHPDAWAFRAKTVRNVVGGSFADGIRHKAWTEGPAAWISFGRVAYIIDDEPLECAEAIVDTHE